jgi:hypothetical protein
MGGPGLVSYRGEAPKGDLHLRGLLIRFCGFRRSKRGPDCETRGSHAGRSGILDVDETGIPNHAQEIPNRDRAAYSIGPGFEAVGQFCRQVFVKNNVGQL